MPDAIRSYIEQTLLLESIAIAIALLACIWYCRRIGYQVFLGIAPAFLCLAFMSVGYLIFNRKYPRGLDEDIVNQNSLLITVIDASIVAFYGCNLLGLLILVRYSGGPKSAFTLLFTPLVSGYVMYDNRGDASRVFYYCIAAIIIHMIAVSSPNGFGKGNRGYFPIRECEPFTNSVRFLFVAPSVLLIWYIWFIRSTDPTIVWHKWKVVPHERTIKMNEETKNLVYSLSTGQADPNRINYRDIFRSVNGYPIQDFKDVIYFASKFPNEPIVINRVNKKEGHYVDLIVGIGELNNIIKQSWGVIPITRSENRIDVNNVPIGNVGVKLPNNKKMCNIIGIREGDIIQSIDGQAITNIIDCAKIAFKNNKQLKVVYRHPKTQHVKLITNAKNTLK